MMKPKRMLSAKDYQVYRSVRAIAALFVLLGAVEVLSGTLMLTGPPPDPRESGIPAVLAVILVVAGACGILVGTAILCRRPTLARLAYGWGVLYVLMFPVGTILSLYLWSNLGAYLRILPMLKADVAHATCTTYAGTGVCQDCKGAGWIIGETAGTREENRLHSVAS
jgi:hypothetical protein